MVVQHQPTLLRPDVLQATRFLRLADNLEIEVDSAIGQSIACFGLPGSGKTNAGVLLAEQFGQHLVPMVVFDREGDWLSLAEVLPRAIVATRDRCPSGYEVLEHGLQVIYDLSSWPGDDAAAAVIVQVVSQLDYWASARPAHERIPCLVFLDEAAHWLPERRGKYLEEESFAELLDTFTNLAARGRKRGLTPAYFTPRISELAKAVLTPGVYFFMKQTLDTDLNRYMSYLTPPADLSEKQFKARISNFATGRAMVKLPGAQKYVSFHKRQSRHISHTPRVQAAINRYAAMPFDPDMAFAPFAVSAALPVDPQAGQGGMLMESPGPAQSSVPSVTTLVVRERKPKHALTIRERVTALLTKDRTLSSRDLAAIIGCPQNTVQIYRKVVLAELANRPISKVGERIVAILAAQPDINNRDLGLQAHCSFSEAKQWRERILAEARSATDVVTPQQD